MRITLLQGIVAMVFSGLAVAHDNHAQTILDRKVSVKVSEVSLDQVLSKISTEEKIRFVYSPSSASFGDKVSLDVTSEKLGTVLENLLTPRGIGFAVDAAGDYIILKEKKETPQPDETVLLQSTDADPITGTVKDKNGTPLPGVSIVVKGTTRGVVTDADGKYSIDVNEGETLVFSFIGYKTIEEQLNGRTSIELVLEEDAATLKEVTVIGTDYFSTTKEMSTMNISKVDGEDIERQPVTSLMNSVVGRMAGVDITPVNGTAGIAPRIQIRGTNSIRPGGEGSYPLYVIDGIQIESRPVQSYSGGAFSPGFDPLSSINPADIESIEVLKDAAATAIYGSRGANGVVRITTKKAGKTGKTGINLGWYSGIGQVSREMELLTTRQYMEMRHEALKNSGIDSPGITDYDLSGVWDSTRYTNFQKELLGNTANIIDFHGGISGGTSQTSFAMNAGYHKEGTIYPGDFGMQRITADLSLNHTSADNKLNVVGSVYYGWTNNKSFSDLNFVSTALQLPPVAPELKNDSGDINFEEIELFPGYYAPTFENPLAALLKTDDAKSNNIMSNTVLSYEILTGLTLRNSLSLQYFANNQVTKVPLASYAPSQRQYYTGQATFSNNSRTSVMVEPQIIYDKKFSDHQINATLGWTWQSRNSTYRVDDAYGYQADELLNSLKGASDIFHAVDDYIQYKYAATYARIGYSFRNRYIIDLTGRRDGSSRFGPGKKYGNFGAISAAWIFSNEGFIKNNISFMSFGKFRGSYGRTGNDQIPDYQYYNTFSPTTYFYQGAVSLKPTSLFNPSYGWEVTKKSEIAVELGFMQDRVFLEAAWYRNVSSNQLINYRLPGTTGFPSILSNFPATVDNTGIEIVLNTQNIARVAFRWNTSFNFSMPRNELVEFNGLETSPYSKLYKVGEPLSIQYLYTYQGVDPMTGNFAVKDKDGDGNITESDKSFMAPTGRKYYGGLSNTISFHNFELSFLFQFSKSRVSGFIVHPTPGIMSNQPSRVLNRWQNEGDITSEAAFTAGENVAYYQNNILNSDKNIATVSFWRLKTATLSYRIPSSLLTKMKMRDLQVFLQGQNLLTFTDFDKALDPETINSLPPLRIITLGVQLKI